MTQNPPAGWHPDPNDPTQIRYWDGDSWSEHTQPAATGGPAGPLPPAAPAAQPGKPERPWWKKKRWIAAAVIALLIIIGSISGGGGSSSDKTNNASDKISTSPTTSPVTPSTSPKTEKASPKPTPKPAEKVVAVRAADIIKQYEDNELAADSKYKGKKLAITGIISKIDTEMFDSNDYTVELNGGGDYEILTVTAYDIPNSDIAKLNKGQRVTVVCDFKDGGDLGVTVNHCKLG